MPTGLQAKNTLNLAGEFYSGGYPGEDTGATGQYQDWTDVPLSGTSTATYWYSDSDSANNANSLKVCVDIQESWSARINFNNSIDISYSTKILKIEKRNIYGNPGTTLRTIKISQSPGSPWLYVFENTPMRLYTVASELPTISGTIHLSAQSDSGGISTLYYKSGYPRHFDDPLPSKYVDAMGVGISFRNVLYEPYKPGQRKINGVWRSLNRSGGSCNRHGYGEMYSSNGGVGTDDPPYRKQNSIWRNQRRIGAE